MGRAAHPGDVVEFAVRQVKGGVLRVHRARPDERLAWKLGQARAGDAGGLAGVRYNPPRLPRPPAAAGRAAGRAGCDVHTGNGGRREVRPAEGVLRDGIAGAFVEQLRSVVAEACRAQRLGKRAAIG